MATRFRAWVTVVALAALLAGGCTSGESSSSGGTTNLPDGLGAVKDVGSSRMRFAWADMGQLRKLTGLTSASAAAHKRGDPKWSRLLDVGVDTELEPQLTQATGIDAYKASRAISIGVTPNKATRLDGMVGAAVTKKMNALGATQEKAFGRTFLVLAGEGQVDMSNPKLGNNLFLALNRVALKGSAAAFGLADAPLDAVLGGGRSLSSVGSEAAVADCLGDVFVADIMAPPAGAAFGVSLLGAGVRRPQPGDPRVREVLCEAVQRGQDRSVADAVRTRVIPEARLPVGGYQVLDEVSQASVEQLSSHDVSLVRLTIDLVAPARAGFLLFDQRAGLAFLGGGAAPVGASG
jgi:hypothetical protein